MSFLTFPSLAATSHRFVLRHPNLSMDVERTEALARLAPWHGQMIRELGYPEACVRTAEQVHGEGIAVVDAASPALSLGADGLITQSPDVLLGIYVADCGAVYLHDPKQPCIGLVHSGKKGTELGIVAKAIGLMNSSFGSNPSDIIVQLSPCIRPPAYEVDFAGSIRQQCFAAGINPAHFHDDGICTSSDLTRFYSYRIEKGRTGRMLALLGLKQRGGA